MTICPTVLVNDSSKMPHKLYVIYQFITITCCLFGIEAHNHSLNQPSSRNQLVNNIQELGNNVLSLPSRNFSADIRINHPKMDSLFKLNTDVLFDRDFEEDAKIVDHSPNDENEEKELRHGAREARKMNFLRGLWNKPKVSPLYLVNGTVCRFVNTTPICTTLTTTGLLPSGTPSTNPSTSGQAESNTPNVQFPFNNQQQFSSNQLQVSAINSNPQQFQFTNSQPQTSSPILDDDSQDISVSSDGSNTTTTESSTLGNSSSNGNSNTTTTTTSVPQQQTTTRPTNSSAIVRGNSRPVNLAANRRPMNLLSLRRPMRQFHLNTVRTA